MTNNSTAFLDLERDGGDSMVACANGGSIIIWIMDKRRFWTDADVASTLEGQGCGDPYQQISISSMSLLDVVS